MIVKPKHRIKKTPIENKDVLNEAYDYPRKVSFVRGMRVDLDNHVMLFISGTASVNERERPLMMVAPQRSDKPARHRARLH